ncbi:CrcB family protein [Halomicroarcula limicola]|uniref:Fluoride-specific ion channel FluC n=1 Tax=Haloarcula limicola TaxID=1429915 RepID=A0A8J8C884_9EURY|nr:CrcB family protein [Halomicroarcula limicola]MBV0924325.1 CrcB family protein [Halomicroarcula limicola]
MAGSHALSRVEPLLLVAVGGFAGAVLRRSVALAAPGIAALDGAVVGTLVVNVAGSFALGVLLYEAHLANALSAETRLVLGTGFLSSFTTYSTFAVQTSGLPPALAVTNVAANYALAFAGVVLGRLVARWLS